MPAQIGNEPMLRIPISTKLTAGDLKALRDRARLEQMPPTTLLRKLLRQYLQTPAKVETPAN